MQSNRRDRRETRNGFPLFPKEPRYRVISLPKSLDLLWSRETVLRTAGFQVFSTTSKSQALARLRAGDLGVLLLCYTLSEDVRKNIVSEFRKHCPKGGIVAIADVNSAQPPVGVDAWVRSSQAGVMLVDAVLGNDLPKAA